MFSARWPPTRTLRAALVLSAFFENANCEVPTAYVSAVCDVEGALTNHMKVCAKHTYAADDSVIWCVSSQPYYGWFPLAPGGNATFHFSQLVVANTITVSKLGLLTLCEVDVLGFQVLIDPEGQMERHSP